jgi:hypothetical protein
MAALVRPWTAAIKPADVACIVDSGPAPPRGGLDAMRRAT